MAMDKGLGCLVQYHLGTGRLVKWLHSSAAENAESWVAKRTTHV